MKKSLILVFAVFYLLLASGLNISLHYCGGKLKTISFNSSVNEKNCCGNREKSKGCCHEKSTFVKVKDDQFSGASVKILVNPIKSFCITGFNELFEIQKPNITYTALNNHSPPVFYDNPIYLKQKVIII